MRSTKHIVFFTPGFPENEEQYSCLPTVQNYIREFAEQKRDWNVTVLSLHYPFKAGEYHWNAIRVIALGGKNVSYPSRFSLWRTAWRQLAALHREQPISLIHSFWMHECGMLGNLFAKSRKIPQVISLMGQDLKRPNHFARFIDQQYATLVALSEFWPDKPARIRRADAIIPFGIPEREREWIIPRPKTIDVIGVGSLIQLKAYEIFIELIDRLRSHFPAIKAEIIGDGAERGNLHDLIGKHKLEDHITLCGQLSRKEVYSKMCSGRVFLHTSKYETQGYVFNEALMAGLPIVSTCVGIAHEKAYWKTGKNMNEMEEGLKYFLNNNIRPPEDAGSSMAETVENYWQLYIDAMERSLPKERI